MDFNNNEINYGNNRKRFNSSVDFNQQHESPFLNAKKLNFFDTDAVEEEEVVMNEEDFKEENDADSNNLTVSFLYLGNKLGCSYYDRNKKTLFYLNDLPGEFCSVKIEILAEIKCKNSNPIYICFSVVSCFVFYFSCKIS